ncbi:MAG: hypothetical protein ACREOQ_08550 [Gemmatimonadales bacterium]
MKWTVLLALAVPAAAGAQSAPDHLVQVQMRNVAFHVDSTIVLDIAYARGRLKRMAPDHPPYLDDKRSFVLALDTARIGISPAALSGLLNRYTFAYPGSPLRRLTITIEHGRLRQHGTMRGISFDVVGDLSLTPEGELRLHPATIKAVGIKVGGLMKFFGLNLQKLVNTEHARGVRIEGDDFLLSPTRLLPPPAVEGRVGRVEVNDSQIVQIFRPAEGRAVDPLVLPIPKTPNYMFFCGGVLRFGKLTMDDTDLFIEDAAPEDPFDFWLDRYNDQLVGGGSRNTRDHGLIVEMPDFAKLGHRGG